MAKKPLPSLLALLPAEHKIAVEPVPPEVALRPGLVKIIITKIQGDQCTKWYVPVQWTPAEAAALLYEIRGVSWQLRDDGWPLAFEEIHEICNQFCKEQLK